MFFQAEALKDFPNREVCDFMATRKSHATRSSANDRWQAKLVPSHPDFHLPTGNWWPGLHPHTPCRFATSPRLFRFDSIVCHFDKAPTMAASRPPSPPSGPQGIFSVPFERFVRDEISDWAGAFPLLGLSCFCPPQNDPTTQPLPDTMETYFDSRLDLLQRTLTKHSDRLKLKAEVALNDVLKMKPPSGDDLAGNFDREVQKFRLKVRVISVNFF